MGWVRVTLEALKMLFQYMSVVFVDTCLLAYAL